MGPVRDELLLHTKNETEGQVVSQSQWCISKFFSVEYMTSTGVTREARGASAHRRAL